MITVQNGNNVVWNGNMSDDIEKLYNELLYAVESKFSNETRHQTALRYIQEAEEHRNYVSENLSRGLDENGYSLERHSDDCG